MTALKFGKPRPSLLTKREQKRAELAEERRVRAEVKKRDNGWCRVCLFHRGIATAPTMHDIAGLIAKRGVEMHHIVPRSLGGKHTTANGIWCCTECHADRHHGVIRITGNGDAEIHVERIWT